MAGRIGIWTLNTLAKKLCSKVAKFAPLIAASFPENAELLAALVAAQTACSALALETEAVIEYGD